MISWGLVSTATMFVADVWSFMAARTLLGIAEAGFFPGMSLYLTYWIPAADRARAGALFMMAAPVAVIIGAPLSEALLKLDGAAGAERLAVALPRSRACPSVVLGLLVVARADRPAGDGRVAAARRPPLAGRRDGGRARHARSRRADVDPPQLLERPGCGCCAAVFFLNSVVNYGMFLWLPRLLRDVTGAEGFTLSAITALPFVAALIAMVVVGRHSDRTGERRVHVAACAAVTARRPAAGGRVAAASVDAGARLHHRADGPAIARRASSGRCRRNSWAARRPRPASR